VVINTVPQVTRKNVSIVNGRHNVVSVSVPQGNLLVKQAGRNVNFPVIVRQKGKHEILNTQNANDVFRYLTGTYEIETITLPRRTYDVTIEYNQTKTITLPTPGLVNINTTTDGIGSIFEIMGDGTEQWVCHLDKTKSRHALNLLPGTYRVAFRASDAGGSKYTGVKTFKLNAGETLNISMF
jgi:Ca-activated chloride channel family protein